jgi:hypothetical protein
LIFLGAILSLIGVLIPALQEIFNQMFTYRVTFFDISIAFVLHCCTGFLGAMAGAFFHPRIFRDRKLAILLAISTALIGYTKGPLIAEIPMIRFVIWIFPPLYDIMECFTGNKYFNSDIIIKTILYGITYGSLLLLIQLYLLKRNKF